MDLLPRQAYPPHTWKDDLASVSGFYGPGAVTSWCLTSTSMLYDANQIFRAETDPFHYLKYVAIIFSSLWALGDAVWRALRTDFGPSYAAALYMSDKGFELATLIYMVKLFPIYRRRPAQTLRQAHTRPVDEEQGNRRLRPKS